MMASGSGADTYGSRPSKHFLAFMAATLIVAIGTSANTFFTLDIIKNGTIASFACVCIRVSLCDKLEGVV